MARVRLGRSEEEQRGSKTHSWKSESPTATTAATGDARRYDSEMVRQALALATQLQNEQTQQNTMTEEQVVETGAEVGLDPAYVRLALALMERQEAEQIGASPSRVSPGARTRAASRLQDTAEGTIALRPLTRKAKFAAVSYPLLYFFISLIVITNCSHGSDYATGILMMGLISGPSLAVFLGATLRSKRLGALSGALIATGFLISCVAHELVREPGQVLGLFCVWLLMMALGAALGTAGALGRRILPRLYVRLARSLTRRFPVLTES